MYYFPRCRAIITNYGLYAKTGLPLFFFLYGLQANFFYILNVSKIKIQVVFCDNYVKFKFQSPYISYIGIHPFFYLPIIYGCF